MNSVVLYDSQSQSTLGYGLNSETLMINTAVREDLGTF